MRVLMFDNMFDNKLPFIFFFHFSLHFVSISTSLTDSDTKLPTRAVAVRPRFNLFFWPSLCMLTPLHYTSSIKALRISITGTPEVAFIVQRQPSRGSGHVYCI